LDGPEFDHSRNSTEFICHEGSSEASIFPGTDPDAKPCRKSSNAESKLSYLGT